MKEAGTPVPGHGPPLRGWRAAASRRRAVLAMIILATTLVASGYMAYVLPYGGRSALEFILLIFFAMLFAWISIGFWTSLMGFILLLRRSDPWNMADPTEDGRTASTPLPVTAVVMPVYNEAVDRVFAGLAAIYRSVENTGMLGAFEFFVLSDSTDPDRWVHEEHA
ncbi:MAG TPA: hypothetical protein VLT88_07990, partial [Desulfosarcina sp.]|nr:hypothetical protein [Desulfosarcina sp.]